MWFGNIIVNFQSVKTSILNKWSFELTMGLKQKETVRREVGAARCYFYALNLSLWKFGGKGF